MPKIKSDRRQKVAKWLIELFAVLSTFIYAHI